MKNKAQTPLDDEMGDEGIVGWVSFWLHDPESAAPGRSLVALCKLHVQIEPGDGRWPKEKR